MGARIFIVHLVCNIINILIIEISLFKTAFGLDFNCSQTIIFTTNLIEKLINL